jgi:signal transduction histidine kinase/ActR/RegA family two-component response regulator
VEDLRAAQKETETLNEALELRVQARTAELHRSTEQLRVEIAQRQETEERLLRARKLESLGVMAGGIAHDFNNFLTVVQGNIELAKQCLNPGEAVQEILDQAAIGCRRAAFLSSQLLTFAKGGAPVRRVVSVATLIMDAVQLARTGAAIHITVTMAEDLPSAEVDPAQIGQVLRNILLNAGQAMPAGGIIEVRAASSVAPGAVNGGWVRISIQDHGCGIAEDVLPRIFDPYFTTRPDASGLGLATAYAIVAKHGGHTSVESKLGAGTVVTVELPASRQTAPAAAVTARRQTSTGRLLVMDDEEALRSLLKAVLTSLGYDVQTARDGAEAIALYEGAKADGKGFDAVLLDLTVTGGMGGMETAAKLKELDPVAKLIVSSGYSDSPIMSDFASYGFDAIIPKPWTASEMSDVFRKMLAADPERKPSKLPEE